MGWPPSSGLGNLVWGLRCKSGSQKAAFLAARGPVSRTPRHPASLRGLPACSEGKDPAAASCWWGAGEGGVVRVASLRRVPRDPCPAGSGIKAAAPSMRRFPACHCNRIGTFEVNRKRGGSHAENAGRRAPGASVSWAGRDQSTVKSTVSPVPRSRDRPPHLKGRGKIPQRLCACTGHTRVCVQCWRPPVPCEHLQPPDARCF